MDFLLTFSFRLLILDMFHKGKGPATKLDEFLEKVPKGGKRGLFLIQKFMLQVLGTLNRGF